MNHQIAKILIFLLLISALVCGFTACNNDTDGTNGDGSSQGNQVSHCEEHTWNYECSAAGHTKVCTSCSKMVIAEYDKESCAFCRKLKTLQYELSKDRKSYVVAGLGNVISANVVIPPVYNQLPITAIGEKAFYGCESIVTVTLPEGITSIGQSAFSGCSNMTEINLPDSLTDIGESAFSKCEKLGSVSIPEGIKEIKNSTFSSCKSLSVTLPTGLEKIGEIAFAYCGFSSIDIPDGVTEIGDYAFSECEMLESITIPDSVVTIGYSAFDRCTSLTDVTIGKGVTFVGSHAFADTKITEIVLPDAVDTLYSGVFNRCSDLKSVTARGVTKVLYSAFSHCANLETLILSDNIEYAERGIFYNATQAFIKVYEGMRYFGMSGNPYAVLMERDDETRKDVVVHQDTVAIAPEAFWGTDIESITMGDSVVNIGQNSFGNCKALASVYIGNGVEIIEESTFDSCDALVSVHLGSSVKSIGQRAFGGCSKLSDINFPSSLESIGEDAFRGCADLAEVILPDGLKNIGAGAFLNCSKLNSIKIGADVESIGQGAFTNTGSVEEIIVSPDNEYYYSAGNCLIEKATKKLIRGCGNSVIPDDGSIAIIGSGAFSSSNLPDVTYVPDSVTVVETNAFNGSDEFTAIVINKKLKEIDFGYTFMDTDTSLIIYYEGAEKDWARVRIYGILTRAQVYFYSEEEPAEEGNFWHYVDGVPTPW